MNEAELLPYITALSLGFFGASHCIGMCGGIVSALSFGLGERSRLSALACQLAYNIGRISSYAAAGAIMGWFGQAFADQFQSASSLLRWLAGLLLIAMGLYLANWWNGLTILEKGGSYLWRYIQPLGKNLLPVKGVPQALALGAVWGWLPCGLVYSTLSLAATRPEWYQGALLMACFGLGTLPSMMLAGPIMQQLKTRVLQKTGVRSLVGIAIIGFGVWTIYGGNMHAGHGGHAGHGATQHSSEGHEGMDHSTMDHSNMDHATMDHSNMDHATMDHSNMDHATMDHSSMDHATMDHSSMDHSSMEHPSLVE